jgi:alkylation response protein AidB-like acyl-CoA dehydrogenase
MSATTVPDLLPTPEQEDLRSTVRSLLATHLPVTDVLHRADTDDYADGPWRRIVDDLGIGALAVPEERGGGGATWREVAIVAEELGRVVADVPFLTASIAMALLEAAGAHALVSELTGAGDHAAILIPWDQSVEQPVDVTLVGGRLRGQVPVVAGARDAAVLLVIIGESLVAVAPASAELLPVVALDMTRALTDVSLDGAEAAVLADGPIVARAVEYARDVAAVLLAAEALGLAEAAAEHTLAYVRERHQFGRAIGSYQAVKHRIADLWTRSIGVRAAVDHASVRAAEDDDDLCLVAAVAQSVSTRLAVDTAAEMVQLHGGIGFTWEQPAHLFLKRARVDALALGGPATLARRIDALAGL